MYVEDCDFVFILDAHLNLLKLLLCRIRFMRLKR